MTLALWICRGLLAVIFALSGAAKVSQPRERLIATGQTGVAVFPMPVVRLTAVCELFAALGLILPAATGVAAWLTPLAAVGLGVVMVGAMRAHAKLHEPRSIAINVTLLAVCLFVAVASEW
jgi:uncharacterized membrane protein YphA (DoxX/SURF4 family)